MWLEWKGEAKAEQEEEMRKGLGSQREDLRFDETRKEVSQMTLAWVGSGNIKWQGKEGLWGRGHLRLLGSPNQASSVRTGVEVVNMRQRKRRVEEE